jgi:hypothetical protein
MPILTPRTILHVIDLHTYAPTPSTVSAYIHKLLLCLTVCADAAEGPLTFSPGQSPLTPGHRNVINFLTRRISHLPIP